METIARTATERLVVRLRECPLLDIPADAEFIRTRASRDAVSSGKWSWFLQSRTAADPIVIGSQYPVWLLLTKDMAVARGAHWSVWPLETTDDVSFFQWRERR